VRGALRLLRGESDAARAIMPVLYPNFPGLGIETTSGPGAGQAQLSLVRTANPQQYKPEGATVRQEGFQKHPVVHACIRVIADIVASVPLVVLQARGDSEARVPERHPLQALLDMPGPRFTARQMRARMAVDFLGYGNVFLELDRLGTGGAPKLIRPINAEAVQSVWVDTDGDPRRYDYANWSGIILQRDVADVIHIRDLYMPRPFQVDLFGFPRGATAIASIAADNEATNYVRQVVTNDGTPTFAVLLSEEATSDDAQAMQDRYRARTVDRGKRGTPAFFGSVRDIKPLGFTLSDLEFPDLRRVSREDICAAFGVDPRMIGIASATSDAGLSGAQYVEARARLVQHTIEPLLGAIEDELNHWLAPEFGDVWITYDREALRDLVENDEATSTRIRAEFAASLRTWEESRRALKLPPLPEPTDTLAMTTGTQLVPAAVAVIDPRAVQDAPPAAQLAQGDADASDEAAEAEDGADPEDAAEADAEAVDAEAVDAARSDESRADESPLAPLSQVAQIADVAHLTASDPRAWWERLTPEALAAEPRYQYWQRAMDALDGEEKGYYRTARERFAADAQDIAAEFADYTKTAAALTQEKNAAFLRKLERKIAASYGAEGAYYRAWRDAYLDLIGTTYMTGARQAAGLKLNFSLQSPEVLRAIDDRASTLAGYIGEETAKQVTAAIRAAETAGFTVAETARLVQASAYGEQMTDTRATRIARTEAAGAMSQGGWDQARDLGIFRSKEWLAFEDDKTRMTHLFCMAQGRIPIDEMFTNGLQYPLDPAGDAAEVINCRCTLIYYDEAADDPVGGTA